MRTRGVVERPDTARGKAECCIGPQDHTLSVHKSQTNAHYVFYCDITAILVLCTIYAHINN